MKHTLKITFILLPIFYYITKNTLVHLNSLIVISYLNLQYICQENEHLQEHND